MKNLMVQPTRCLLVQPRFSGHSFWNYKEVCELVGAKYPAAPLGLMTVAALLPEHWDLRLVDENVRPLADDDLDQADIVLVSSMLPQQKGALAVIQRAHDRRTPVVAGGPDVTAQPQLYSSADFLVLGEGEVTIPLFIEDLHKQATSGVYQCVVRADMTEAVIPRFDLIRFADYMHVGVQFCRGCPFNCEFCDIIELFGRTPRSKTPEQTVAELQRLYDLGYRGHVDFVDDNFIANKKEVIDVLEAIRDWSRRHHYPFYFSTEASVNLAREDKLLGLMRENDFRYVFVGFESPDEEVLAQTQKRQNKGVSAVDAVRTLNAHGMIVNGGFILGFDGETENTAANMVDMIQDAGICMAMVGTLTALPNTQLSRRLKREGRLFWGGQARVQDASDIDQTTNGLNFATERPRAAILRDYVDIVRRIYDRDAYYERVLMTALQLKPAQKAHLGFIQTLELARGFLKLSAKAGFDHRTGRLYWLTLGNVLLRNPHAIEAAVNLAAMYVHFSEQSAFVIRTLERRIAEVEHCGETNYNQLMIEGQEAC